MEVDDARLRKIKTDILGNRRSRDGMFTSPRYNMFMYIQSRTYHSSKSTDLFVQLVDNGIVTHFIPHFDLIMNVICRLIAEML